MADIDAFLEDLAARPETARHIAGKLAVHFISDMADAALVDALAATYRDTGGDLRRGDGDAAEPSRRQQIHGWPR
jgi:uncharacterized protein (DUF1800 family)